MSLIRSIVAAPFYVVGAVFAVGTLTCLIGVAGVGLALGFIRED